MSTISPRNRTWKLCWSALGVNSIQFVCLSVMFFSCLSLGLSVCLSTCSLNCTREREITETDSIEQNLKIEANKIEGNFFSVYD